MNVFVSVQLPKKVNPFHSKVTFAVGLSPFLESEICYSERQEWLVSLKAFHKHKRKQFSSTPKKFDVNTKKV